MSFKPRALSALRRFSKAAAIAVSITAVTVTSPAVASAQMIPGVPSSSDLTAKLHEDVWNARNHLHSEAERVLDPQSAQNAKNAVDGVTNAVAPGMIDQKNREAEEARMRAEAQRLEQARANFDYGPCPKHAAACIDLTKQRTWLQKNGVVWGGERPMSSGAPGWETPKGTHRVNRKVKDEISREFNNAPMPYSVYFTHNGIAFHEGDVDLWSHGCIHLNHNDAVQYFNELKPGDIVYVY